MSIRGTVLEQFKQVAKEMKCELASLSDEVNLLDTGLDSLGFAILVARLEEALNFDPFSGTGDLQYPVTMGDFIRLYENAGGAESGSVAR